MLKGVIVTCTGVFVTRGQVDQKMVRAVIRLLKFVENKGLKPVVLSNTVWHSRASDGTKTPLRKIFQSKIPTLDWYSCNEDAAVPAKPTKQSTVFVREQYDWAENEVVYIGNSQADMRTAVNGSLLFLTRPGTALRLATDLTLTRQKTSPSSSTFFVCENIGGNSRFTRNNSIFTHCPRLAH